MKKEMELTGSCNLGPQPVARVVKLANKYNADIRMSKGGHEVNGKSLMGVMELLAHQGKMTISAEGDDADEAVQVLAQELKDLGC